MWGSERALQAGRRRCRSGRDLEMPLTALESAFSQKSVAPAQAQAEIVEGRRGRSGPGCSGLGSKGRGRDCVEAQPER